jgi:hypothetical protein
MVVMVVVVRTGFGTVVVATGTVVTGAVVVVGYATTGGYFLNSRSGPSETGWAEDAHPTRNNREIELTSDALVRIGLPPSEGIGVSAGKTRSEAMSEDELLARTPCVVSTLYFSTYSQMWFASIDLLTDTVPRFAYLASQRVDLKMFSFSAAPCRYRGMTVRMLGKAPYVHDPRSLRLEKYAVGLPAPKPWVNWALKAKQPWGAMYNDSLGCCVISHMGHSIQSWSAAVGSEITVPDSAILTGYEAVGGYVPGNPSTDNGCVIADGLKYWKATGIAGHTIGAYLEVPQTNHTLLRQAIELFGSVSIGLQLPVAAQNLGTYWNMAGAKSLTGNWAPGSWGGHCVAVIGYNNGSYICVSWGEIIRISVLFWDNYCDESWCSISPDFFSGAKSASGLDLSQMQTDLALL